MIQVSETLGWVRMFGNLRSLKADDIAPLAPLAACLSDYHSQDEKGSNQIVNIGKLGKWTKMTIRKKFKNLCIFSITTDIC